VPADLTIGGGEERGVDPTLYRRNYQKHVRVLTRQPLKDKESREIDRSLLKGFLLLQISAKKRFTSGGRNPRPDGLRPPYASHAP